MPIDWSSDAAQNYNVLFRRGIVSRMEGVMSQESVDFVYNNGETYRDSMDAAFWGRASALAGVAGGTDAIVIANGDQTTVQVSGGTFAYSTPSDPQFEESDEFKHEPPRVLDITRTQVRWWSDAAGAGNLLGWAWLDELISIEPEPFERI